MTSVEHHDPVATSTGEEQEAARRVEVPTSRKRAVSADIISEWVVKRKQLPRPSVASPVPSSPVVDAAEQAGWSEEQTGNCVSMGLVPTSGS